jgi:hypothetical protein
MPMFFLVDLLGCHMPDARGGDECLWDPINDQSVVEFAESNIRALSQIVNAHAGTSLPSGQWQYSLPVSSGWLAGC